MSSRTPQRCRGWRRDRGSGRFARFSRHRVRGILRAGRTPQVPSPVAGRPGPRVGQGSRLRQAREERDSPSRRGTSRVSWWPGSHAQVRGALRTTLLVGATAAPPSASFHLDPEGRRPKRSGLPWARGSRVARQVLVDRGRERWRRPPAKDSERGCTRSTRCVWGDTRRRARGSPPRSGARWRPCTRSSERGRGEGPELGDSGRADPGGWASAGGGPWRSPLEMRKQSAEKGVCLRWGRVCRGGAWNWGQATLDVARWSPQGSDLWRAADLAKVALCHFFVPVERTPRPKTAPSSARAGGLLGWGGRRATWQVSGRFCCRPREGAGGTAELGGRGREVAFVLLPEGVGAGLPAAVAGRRGVRTAARGGSRGPEARGAPGLTLR